MVLISQSRLYMTIGPKMSDLDTSFLHVFALVSRRTTADATLIFELCYQIC